MLLRYEDEVRSRLENTEEAQIVRDLRVDQGFTWRSVGDFMCERWQTNVGRDDSQSLGATVCHIAAVLLGEDPDAEPWN